MAASAPSVMAEDRCRAGERGVGWHLLPLRFRADRGPPDRVAGGPTRPGLGSLPCLDGGKIGGKVVGGKTSDSVATVGGVGRLLRNAGRGRKFGYGSDTVLTPEA